MTKRVGCFSLIILAVLSLSFWFTNDTFAVCNSTGYCYGAGSNPRGGKCGDPSNTGAWWDTCFGLSWQYYEWPEGYTDDIRFPGSTNAGYAVVDGQCSRYGGFWFLGYEVYRPSNGESLGYQAGAPRVGMLADYDESNGYTQLYIGENPAPNPAITVTTSSGTTKLRGSKYGTKESMDNDGEIRKLFNKYANAVGNELGLVSGSGVGATTTTFADINWFCAEQTIPVPEEGEVEGLVEVVYGTKKATAGWNKSGEANINITLNEGQTAEDITFNDYMKGDGDVVRQRYTISGDFLNGSTETDYFVAPADDQEPHIVGSHTQDVSTSGKYCEYLEFTDKKGVLRTMHACATVKVLATPPEIFGRVGVEATIYDENGDVKSVIPLSETAWNDNSDPPLTTQIHLGNTDKVSIRFVDSMKGVGENPTRVEYNITNNALSGVVTNDDFVYGGGDASGQATVIKETFINDVDAASLICETLSFGGDNTSVVACANITKDGDDELTTTPINGDGTFNFNVDVDLKLSVSLSNHLVADSGVNQQFLRDSTILSVSSNNIDGYVATFTTDKKSTNENATRLIHDYKPDYIQTLDSAVARGEFPEDRWGYSLDDTIDGDDDSQYLPVVAMDSNTPSVVMSSNGPAQGSQEIFFGTKMGLEKSAGTYSNSIVFKVVATIVPPAPTTIDEIEYMQDINDDVLASMVRGQQYKLKDARDEKEYWVAKLPNDYVMMTQNLDFELKKGDVLNSITTDIGYGDTRGDYKSGRNYWLVDHTTQDTTIGGKSVWYERGEDGNYLPYYVGSSSNYDFNPGGARSYRVASDPMVGTFGVNSYDYYLGANATPAHYLDNADCAASTEYTEEECAHYSVGVLYNDGAAMAGAEKRLGSLVGVMNTSMMITDSICPKGWRLLTYMEYERLYYDFATDGSDYGYRNNISSMRLAPFYMGPTQSINYYSYQNLEFGYVNSGNDTSTWSAHYWMARQSGQAGIMVFYSGTGVSTTGYGSSFGSPVRCVARHGMNK